MQKYLAIKQETADETKYESSLFFLSDLLYKKYKIKTVILIDEYDTPIHAGYKNNFYDKVVFYFFNG